MALTDLAAKAIKPNGKRQEIPDGAGLYLVVQPSGAKSWAYRGRVNGEWKKITLGSFPDLKPTAARALAGAARAAAHEGRAFAAPRPEGGPEVAPKGSSVSEVWALYRKLRLEPECRKSTVKEHSRIFAAHIEPKLGRRNIATIDKPDLLPIADAALKRGFSARNKTIAVLTAFFGDWCHIKRDHIAADPTRGIEQTLDKKQTNGPKRALDDAEIAKFWTACDAVPLGAMFQLMLLTGCRRNEVAGMSDSEIKGNAWTIPPERTKNGKELKVTLTKTAQAILREIPRVYGCPYVFGPCGEKCSFGYSKAKSGLDAVAKIAKPWRLHDLRRTMRSGLGRLGVREEIAERCVNHPPGGLKAIYDQHKYEREMAEAWQTWESHVLSLVS
jgi:integrase